MRGDSRWKVTKNEGWRATIEVREESLPVDREPGNRSELGRDRKSVNDGTVGGMSQKSSYSQIALKLPTRRVWVLRLVHFLIRLTVM